MIDYFYDKKTKTKIFINNPVIEFFPEKNKKNIFIKLWEDGKILTQHNLEIDELYNEILFKLKDILNSYHNIKKNKKYWEICFGLWLRRFITNYYYNWKTIKKFLSENKKKLIFYQTKFNKSEFLYFGIDDYLYLDKTKEFHSKTINEIISEVKDRNIQLKLSDNISFLENVKKIRKKLYRNKKQNLINKLFYKKNISNLKKVFFKTKLNFFESLIVNLKLGQGFRLFPNNLKLGDIISNKKFEPDLKFRSKKYNIYKSDLKNFIFNKVIESLPILFLENYKSQNLLLETLNLPKKPHLIATAWGYQTSTLYAQYIANKVEEGSKFYIFQHGGSYGQFKNHFAGELDILLSDKFFTWGWTHRNEIPFYILKKINFYKKSKDRKKILLEIRSNSIYPKAADIYNSPYQSYRYYTECLKFFELIKNSQIERDLLIKLSPRQYDYDEKKMFLKVNENLQFADRHTTMLKNREKSKYLIFTTISTGHLEAVASNYPFFILDVYPDIILDRYKFLFKKMEHLKLLHNTADSLFQTIKNLPSDINEWWLSNKIQEFLTEYRGYFARYDPKDKINLFCRQIKN